jgi:sugar O-acyltransferase (sialic acid O-acetyltransferase NeuD family)
MDLQRMNFVIMGASGFAIELAALVRAAGGEVAGFIAPEARNLPAPWLGGDEVLETAAPGAEVLVAVGDPGARARLSEIVCAKARKLATFVSPDAFVADDAVLEEGVMIYPNATVHSRVRLGRGVLVNSNASVGHETCVGDFSNVGPGVALGGRCNIGKWVYLGIGSVILEELSVANGAVIGAAALVTRNIDAAGTYAGVPARRL